MIALWGTKEIQVHIKYSFQENVLLDNVYFYGLMIS